MIGLDTNVLLRWLFRGQSVGELTDGQAKALWLLLANNEDGIFINDIVVVELAWVLKQRARLSKAEITDVLATILGLENAVVKDREILLDALNSFEKSSGDFADHVIGEINRRHGCTTTMTFDRAAARSPNFTELRS